MMNFQCAECGINCSFHTTGTDERQLSQKVIEHMHTVHDMDAIPADVLLKVHRSIWKQKRSGKDHTEPATEPIFV
jgi:predicted small metal-binding protein